jgi:ADP-ribose pyrophosphatase
MEWTTVDSEVAYTCEGFDIVSQTVALPDGERVDFDYLSEGESVVILPFTPEDRVVVIDEWRQAVDRVNRGLPAGSIEDGEQPGEAVARELREETGYEPASFDHLISVEPANGFSDAVFHYFVARDCEPTASQQLDTDESIEVSTTSYRALLDAVREGELRDGRSMLGVLYYLLADGSE